MKKKETGRNDNSHRVPVAVIGCGAIARAHIETLQKKNARLVVAVDVDERAAEETATRYGFDAAVRDYRDIVGKVEAAIICVPNYLHCPVALELMKAGVHVLCEKPLAINYPDAKKMAECAEANSVTLSVANVRRYYWSSRRVMQLIAEAQLGKVVSICVEEGGFFSWPTRSGFFFDKKKSGGGVTIDIGSHVLDLILWWMGKYPRTISYEDDSYGGVEADAHFEMGFDNSEKVSVKLSRIRNLRNEYKICLEGGTIVLQPDQYNHIQIKRLSERAETIASARSRSFLCYFEEMIDDFLECATIQKKPQVGAVDVLQSIRLIDDCYSQAEQMHLPWLECGVHTDSSFNPGQGGYRK